MYILVLATDYDGTLAHDGVVADSTVQALERLRRSGRAVVLVTGRELVDLERVCPRLDLFDRVVAENGAYLYTPQTRSGRALAPPPPAAFVDRLRAERIEPLSVGAAIVATWEPNEGRVLAIIRELGLDLQIIFNKGAVMVLPSGCNKASGLAVALDDLGLSSRNAAAVGDAENDLAFMRSCGCSVAVANALPAVKDACDIVTAEPRGAGVEALVARLIDDEAGLLAPSLARLSVPIGTGEAGAAAVALGPLDGPVLVCGGSGAGKSTLVTSLVERLSEQGFQLCICDPEGDYGGLDEVVVFGDAKTPARCDAALDALAGAGTDVVVNMLGIDIDDRPALFQTLFPALLALQARTGRPHWIVVDEAHHMLPAGRPAEPALPAGSLPVLFVTTGPDVIAAEVVRGVRLLLAVGEEAPRILASFCRLTGRPSPELPARLPGRGEALAWRPDGAEDPALFTVDRPRQRHLRHTRKYAEGTLGEDRSFFFTGPRGAMRLRAQNLMLFMQIGEGVDDDTYLYHLRGGHYSTWMRDAIKDAALAEDVAQVEGEEAVPAAEARRRVRAAIEARYTAPAEPPA